MTISADYAPGNVQDDGTIVTIDRFVPHVSTVPANRGQLVGLFVREKMTAATQRTIDSTPAPVVLFVHGGFLPGVVAYDLDYRDYSYMAAVARAGYDVFALTHTGYGASPKPMMDDPCNIDPTQQHLVVPHVLERPCAPRYPFKLVSSRTEWDEIETVADFIRDLRGVERISLVGWSTGAPRAGGYAALHPERVDKLVLLGLAPFFDRDEPPSPLPEPGAPMILQTRQFLLEERWRDDVHCPEQLDDEAVPDVLWRALMDQDGLGAHWAADGRGIMRAPNRMNYGWRANAARISAPTLVLLGEYDNYERRRETWTGLRVDHKAFVKVGCGSHFMHFERPRRFLYRATLEWLECATIDGRRQGELASDLDGRLTPL